MARDNWTYRAGKVRKGVLSPVEWALGVEGTGGCAQGVEA